MLEIKNLQVKYVGAKNPSIQDISFVVEKGDQIAILGPSGCGKTTLLNVIAGLLGQKEAEISGTVSWSENLKDPVIRIVFQEARLLPWRTVEENISFGLESKQLSKNEIMEKVNTVLRMVGLMEYAAHYPCQLSKGMSQRVNFARALVCEPELLLLDEPFSSLDIETKKTIQEQFSKILNENNITSILVTHSIDEALHRADKIIILSKRPSIVKHTMENGSGMKDVLPTEYNFEDYDE